MSELFPKTNPEAAKKLLATPDEKLSNDERQKKCSLAVTMTPMPCPMCFEKVSLVDAADDKHEVGDDYNGKYICPNCETELAKVVPLFLQPGTPRWNWRRKYPTAKKKDERLFSQRELDLLVAEHDVISMILRDPAARARRQNHPVLGLSNHKDLELVTPARLTTYLERRGWKIDKCGSDKIQKSWGGPGGGICYTYRIPVADAEVMAWDVESIAHGEDCSVLRVLVGLLALAPRG